MELALRVFTVPLLGEDRTSAFYDRYNTKPGGMYFHDGRSGINLMWPSAEMTAYSHGYFWEHRTDVRGFRNPADRQDTGLLLLGDSIVYGHGVDDEETVASVLRRDFGYPAYNMARQGDCLYQHYVLLRLFLDEFSPSTVLLFVYSNDLVDLVKTRGADSIDNAPEIDSYDYEAIRRDIRRRSADRVPVPFHERLLLPRLLVEESRPRRAEAPGKIRAPRRQAKLRAMMESGVLPKPGEKVGLEHARAGLSIAAQQGQLPGSWPMLDEADAARARRYYRRILHDLKRRCDERDARLVVVNLAIVQEGFWRAEFDDRMANMLEIIDREATPEAWRYVTNLMFEQRLRSIEQAGATAGGAAREAGVEFLDLTWDFRSADNYLPDDGHLSGEGHRRLAERLHRFLSSGS